MNLNCSKRATIKIDGINFDHSTIESSIMQNILSETDIVRGAKLLGSGSYGQVFEIYNSHLKRNFALKVVKFPKYICSDKSIKEKQRTHTIIFVTKLLSQGRLESALACSCIHRNVLRCYKTKMTDECLMMLLEKADCGTLYEKIHSRSSIFSSSEVKNDPNNYIMVFPEKKVLDWFCQILMGLDYLHSRNIIHRDLNPKNILIFRLNIRGNAENKMLLKISDFGISKILDISAESLSKTTIGTPKYFSPEICQGKSYGCKTDIWSLGCILYELTTLSHPFNETSMKNLIKKITKAKYREIPKAMSYTIHKLVKSLLVKNEKDRPSTHSILKSKLCKTALLSYIEVWRHFDEIENECHQEIAMVSPDTPFSDLPSIKKLESKRNTTGLIRPKFNTPKSLKDRSSAWIREAANKRSITRNSCVLKESNRVFSNELELSKEDLNLKKKFIETGVENENIFKNIEDLFQATITSSHEQIFKNTHGNDKKDDYNRNSIKEIIEKLYGFVDLLNNASYIAISDVYVKLACRKASLFTALKDSTYLSNINTNNLTYKNSNTNGSCDMGEKVIYNLEYLHSLWSMKDPKIMSDWKMLMTYIEFICQSKIKVYHNQLPDNEKYQATLYRFND